LYSVAQAMKTTCCILVLAFLTFWLEVRATAQNAQPLSRYIYVEPHMGTHFKVVLYAKDHTSADGAARAAFKRVAALDAMMSDYRPDSELMRLCQSAVNKPVRVSNELFFVIHRAQEVSRASEGAFDITVGPVVRLWRRARKTHEMPDRDRLAAARALVGYQNIRLDAKNQTVELLKAGMQLDLGGIAKGYAADEALIALEKKGIDRALVAASGDIAVSGPPPDAKGWKIGIAPLEDVDATPSRYLLLNHAAVSTSGDAEQYVEIDGRRYSHIVDPRTGIGLVGRQSVTVVAPFGIMSDSLTKVVCVLGPKRGFQIIDRMDSVASLAIRKSDKGEETFESKRFRNFLDPGQ
jgi:thiamine biosynthesis lipoprotein